MSDAMSAGANDTFNDQGSRVMYLLSLLADPDVSAKLPPATRAALQSMMSKENNSMLAQGVGANNVNYAQGLGYGPSGLPANMGRIQKGQQTANDLYSSQEKWYNDHSDTDPKAQRPSWWGGLGNLPYYQQQSLLLSNTPGQPMATEPMKYDQAGTPYLEFQGLDSKQAQAYNSAPTTKGVRYDEAAGKFVKE